MGQPPHIQKIIPCDCGSTEAYWHGPQEGRRDYCCDECWWSLCTDCGGKGWDIYNGGEVQRCDTCGRFDSDEDAAEAARGQVVHTECDNCGRRGMSAVGEEMLACDGCGKPMRLVDARSGKEG